MSEEEIYDRREQTLVKHSILRSYLERFAHIVGSHWQSITYVDGFAGPWNVRSPDLKDSSFAIALEELRRARATHASRGRQISLRCFFLEENRDAFTQLKNFADQVKDAEVKVENRSFEESIDSVLAFVRRGGRNTFPFIFIDPTGWTGFALKTISPLLRLDPGEVLINFMTGHIRRFLKEEKWQQSFEDLFGSTRFRDRIAGFSGQELDDASVQEYMSSLRESGKFQFVLPAIVLHPEIDRTHFHLIYATRHPKGVEVFKETEKRAMDEMEELRAMAQQRRQEERTGQSSLFPLREIRRDQHYDELRERYLGQSKQDLVRLLRQKRRLLYDHAWVKALSLPLVWENDLKEWIVGWRREGVLEIEGLSGRERVPKRGHDHLLVWRESLHRRSA